MAKRLVLTIPNIFCGNSFLIRQLSRTPVCSCVRQLADLKGGKNTVSESYIQQVLTSHYMKFESGFTCLKTICPKLGKSKTKLIDSEMLYINKTTGHFVCNSCGARGEWPELEENLKTLSHQKQRKYCFKDASTVDYVIKVEPESIKDILTSAVPVKDLPQEEFAAIQEKFGFQELTVATLAAYNVHYDRSAGHLLLPYISVDKIVTGIKRLTVVTSEEGSHRFIKETFVPRSPITELFGWQVDDKNTDEVIITKSEFDVMAVYQKTKLMALSLPKGTSVLPVESLPSLERFGKITLWFGNDVKAWESSKQFVKKLNEQRCYVFWQNGETALPLQALQEKISMLKLLKKSKPAYFKSIVSFAQMRNEVFAEFTHFQQAAGVKWKNYPTLNKLLKGHRRGELTVFTGPTGSGKTTFISDYSLDLCMQGVNTLWGSFEIKNSRLNKIMLQQFAKKDLTKHMDEFEYYADKFVELPIYFMTFFGQENHDTVLETMKHAVYAYDIAHVIVDNLQFMMGLDRKADRFHQQDLTIAAFRRFATSMNCHVTLVIHPRKEEDNEELTQASIFGSAKATQEADNVLILQDKRLMAKNTKYIQVTKNRFDGDLGVMYLKFDKESKSFFVPEKPKRLSKQQTPEIDDTEGQTVTKEEES
ncbi:hypothetical protein ACJMK2_012698 [Sinanodonta woodiana]|uniref:DNA 5'-3' helicase n=1 Tax=Sinanodonta woodiana TaxID=1069815 RepID=A0ABD3V917_SINWO